MQYFDFFSLQVKTFEPLADDTAIRRCYILWKREYAATGNTVTETQHIKNYLSEHLPNGDQIYIATILPNHKSERISKWLTSENIYCKTTPAGLYIDKKDVEIVKTLAYDYKPIAPEFQRRCEDYGITVNASDIYHFIRALPRALVHKNNFHPLYPQQKEFYPVKEIINLNRQIDRWVALKNANLASPADGYLSLATAAEACRVDLTVMSDWLDRYHSRETIFANGQLVVNANFVTTLSDMQSDKIPLKSIVAEIVDCQPTNNQWKTKLRNHVFEKVNASLPDWLFGRRDHPGIPPLKYIVSNKRDAAYKCISAWIDDFPYRPLKNLAGVSNLKLPQMKQLVEHGTIAAIKEDNLHYISNNVYISVQQFNERYVPVDDLLDRLTNEVKSNFNIRLVKHRQNLQEFLKTSRLSENLIENSNLRYPMDAKLTRLLLPSSCASDFSSECTLWLQCFQSSYPKMIEKILHVMSKSFPKTAHLLKENGIKDENKATCDMLLTLLQCLEKAGKELTELSESDLEHQVVSSFNDASIVSANKFSEFIYEANVTKKQYKFDNTGHHLENSAYPKEFFVYMVAAIVDDDFWIRHDLVRKAVKDPDCAALWLNVAIHVMAAWRTTDFVRLPVPQLKYDNQLTLQKIMDGTYTALEAKTTTELYEDIINGMRMKPHKTERYINVPPLYFHIPESCKEPMGIILSIAAAHYGLNNFTETEQSFVQDISDVNTIRKFFGSDFLKACGNRPFSGKRANKSFMQGIEAKAQEEGISPYVSFMMASEIRSHKYYDDSLSRVTTIYLEDGKFSGYSKEYILEQMFERGIMSFITSGLLSMAYGDQYETLPISQQTNIIKSIGLAASQIDDLVQSSLRAETGAIRAIQNTMSCAGSKSPKETLLSIVAGTASAKDLKTICLCHGAGVPCLCTERAHCLGCLYEVRSKNVLLHYLFNYDRQIKIIRNENGAHHSEFEIAKSKWLIKKVLKPGIAEIQTFMNAVSSKEEVEAYAWIMKERLQQYNQAPLQKYKSWFE